MFSFTLRAGGAFIPYIIGHFWERATAAGSMVSLILGSITVVLAERGIINLFGLDPIYPALIVSAISFYVVSIMTSKPNQTTDLKDKGA